MMTKVKLLKTEEVARGTMAFHFERPKNFAFKPGQYTEVKLINPSRMDSEGDSRTFSIASAVEESDVMVATRIRETAFKQLLKELPVGAEVMLDEAGGSYTLHKNPAKPAVFVIGGIGITPIRSILMHAAKSKLPHKLYLFYSNRTPQDAPFFDELQKLPKLNPNFTFIPTMTKPDRLQNWPGETGYVDKAMLERHLGDIHAPIYYVTGPPAMVKGIQQMLARAGIDDEQVRVEEFFGY